MFQWYNVRLSHTYVVFVARNYGIPYGISLHFQVSENFYFDLNDNSLRSMVSQHVGRVDEASKCTQAVFSTTQSLNGIFIVVKVRTHVG